MTSTIRVFFIFFSFVLSLLFFSMGVNAQNKASYSIENGNYRVVAVKHDSKRIESTSNTAELLNPSTSYFPNAFTPDQDGSNDKFGAVGINVEKYELKIFNRWGELLFESNNITHKWDGTHNGTAVAVGVYVYTFFAIEMTTRRSISKTGTVTLLT
ncbi:MAG: gliding motility-associated-like protein [Vicingaceae bacterium]|jgi:gliding motility-associated-like protein